MAGSPYAILAGLCASSASLFGKLSGEDLSFLDQKLVVVVKIACFALMVILNGAMWTMFVKALNSSSSSLRATVLSSATNYFVSGIMGFFVFQEVTGLLWWAGIGLVLIGILLINSAGEKTTKND